jgi:signal peptidase I
LVGLPGETIRIHHGDVYIKLPGTDAFRLERKPLRHQRATQMTVYDDRYRPKALADQAAWQRWQSKTRGWQIDDPGASRYRTEGTIGDYWVELRYRHLVPDPEQWDAVLQDRPLPREARSSLITDFYSYNTNLTLDGSDLLDLPRGDTETAWMQPHWVGDLTLSASLEVASALGEVRFELVKGGASNQCLIDVATGTARLIRDSRTLLEHSTPIRGPGQYQVEFANVDDRMTLIVDGQPVVETGAEYDRGDEVLIPTAADLSPAGIAVRNGSVTVSDLVLKRDIYYTQSPGRIDYVPVFGERYPRNAVELIDFLSDPSQFPRLANAGAHNTYELGEDRFLMLGDNSPRSKDSRGWDSSDVDWDTSNRKSWEVPRKLLTGKAFYVYWPHGVPIGPDLRWGRDTRLLFRPYFERMRWIR